MGWALQKSISRLGTWGAVLALLAACASDRSAQQPQPQRYTGTLRQWFEGQSFTPDGQTESWFYGINEEASRKLAAAFPNDYAPPPQGASERVEIMGVVTPVAEAARRSMSVAAAFSHYITITDLLSVQVIPNACEPMELYAYFVSNSATLTPMAMAQLGDMLGRLRRQLCNVTDIQVVGSTDTVGSAESNQDLSERRAAAVTAFIQGHGFDAALIHAEGRGETALVLSTRDNIDEPLNRNVHIVATSPSPRG